MNFPFFNWKDREAIRAISTMLGNINQRLAVMSQTLQQLSDHLTELATVVDGVPILIDGLVAELKAAHDLQDPAAWSAALDSIDGMKAKLAASLVVGTEAEGESAQG
jgi:uncharacterized coiled-coil protein SlyX